jgi:hypothetical protein
MAEEGGEARRGERGHAGARLEIVFKALVPQTERLRNLVGCYSAVCGQGRADAGDGKNAAGDKQVSSMAGQDTVNWRVEPAGDEPRAPSGPPGHMHSHDRRGRGRRASRKRRRGQRGPDPFDADYYLRRLLDDIANERRSALDTEREISGAIQEVLEMSSEELAEMIEKRYRVRKDGRTIRRNSTLYGKWKTHRDAAKGCKPVDLSRRPAKKTPPRTEGEVAEVDAINGQLVQRQSPNGRVRGGRSRKQLRRDARADAFLRKNGVDLGKFKAE